jgi:hypothetical protein
MSYSDEYSLSDEERVKVESEESSLEDEDFDFLTSERFLEHIQQQITTLSGKGTSSEIPPTKTIK